MQVHKNAFEMFFSLTMLADGTSTANVVSDVTDCAVLQLCSLQFIYITRSGSGVVVKERGLHVSSPKVDLGLNLGWHHCVLEQGT